MSAGYDAHGRPLVQAAKPKTRPFNAEDAQRIRALEEELSELKGRRVGALDTLRDALADAGLGPSSPGNNGAPSNLGDAPQWIARAAAHADVLRDALAPFDSGARLKEGTDNAA